MFFVCLLPNYWACIYQPSTAMQVSDHLHSTGADLGCKEIGSKGIRSYVIEVSKWSQEAKLQYIMGLGDKAEIFCLNMIRFLTSVLYRMKGYQVQKGHQWYLRKSHCTAYQADRRLEPAHSP